MNKLFSELRGLKKQTKECNELAEQHTKYAIDNLNKCINNKNCKEKKQIHKNKNKYINKCTTDAKKYRNVLHKIRKSLKKDIKKLKKMSNKKSNKKVKKSKKH